MDGRTEQEEHAEQIFADLQNISITPFQGWDATGSLEGDYDDVQMETGISDIKQSSASRGGSAERPQSATAGTSSRESPLKDISQDWGSLLNLAEPELTVQYLTGKISFQEFSERMDRESSECVAEETESLLPKTDIVELSKRVKVQLDDDDDDDDDDQEDFSDGLDAKDQDWQPSPRKKKSKKAAKEQKARKKRRRKTDLPKSLEGLMGEANLKLARGDYEEAAKMCLEIIRLAPNAYLPFQTLGMLYEEMDNVEKAMQFYLIATHLRPDEPEEWIRLADMSLEQGNIKQALTCYTQAIKADPNNMEYVWQKCSLHEQLGEHRKALDGYQHILKILPPDSGSHYMQLARSMTKAYHEMGDISSAMKTMENALDTHLAEITSEDVNVLLELLLSQKIYIKSLKVLIRHCGVEIIFADGSKLSADCEINADDLELIGPKAQQCVTPDLLPIDLLVKLIVCLIHTGILKPIQDTLKSLFEEDIDEFGDLYLDVAEAFMDRGHYSEAEPIIRKLVLSKSYNKAAVWLRLGECLNSMGDLHGAVAAYTQVVEKAPSHFGGRVSLSALQQQLGKHEEAIQVLSREGGQEGEMSDQDQLLLLHKCHLLFSQDKLAEFIHSSKMLLFNRFSHVYNPSFMRIVFTYRTHKHRADALRVFLNRDTNLSGMEKPTSFQSSLSDADKSVKDNDLWDIYVKLCDALLKLNQLDELMEITTLGLACPQFMNDQDKIKESEFICLTACVLNKNGQFAYNFIRDICMKYPHNKQAWNLFSQIIIYTTDIRNRKFALGLLMKDPDNRALGIINGHNSLICGTYKHALGEYVAVLRHTPRDPLVNFCIGLCFIHMACQKFSSKKHALVMQGLAFLNIYMELRGENQETYYNIGRALHQLGLKYAAVFYYKKALQFPPVIHDDQLVD
ncbi:general transcription factor 3C polypeptide 3-like isoform X2 [Gigantopelta aegis]|uniref:general transcription factor 3C polypeptide 3-like isoform X2 n=1 Tax=Gigantopelta aegis TaxID=1735272 RepID=UPI001B88DFF8|nr:general transcription factor 3C polypeptide 3-like isoform X2 [Gigantopelta aegis]